MQNRDIIALAAKIAARTQRDPYRAAEEEGVFIYLQSFQELPGAYCAVRDVRMMLLNENLPPPLRRVVCAHEMGHHFLHREKMPPLSRARTPEEAPYIRQAEREANLFAAEFLLADEAVLNLLAEGGERNAAKALGVPPELLHMKRIALGEKGLDRLVREPPAAVDSRLQNMI